jgi:hypothetical protein
MAQVAASLMGFRWLGPFSDSAQPASSNHTAVDSTKILNISPTP